MSITKNISDFTTLKINYLTDEMYEDALENGEINEGELYFTPDTGNEYLPLTGGQVTGPVSFGDSITADEATVGDLVVTGSGSFTNNLQVNSINNVSVGNSPKFTDTITTVTTSGSGNAVTAVSASNGTVTVTKGTTFQTNIVKLTITLAVASWSSSSQSVTATGVTASNTVIISPAPTSIDDYAAAGIKCTAQAANSLTFTCATTPIVAISVNVVAIN